MRVFARSFGVLSLSLVFLSALHAQSIQGASEVLRRGAEARNSKAPADAAGRLAKELEEFPRVTRTLSPEAAAAKWLSLYDRFGKQREYGESNTLVGVLPAPESWPAISAGLKSRSKGQPSGVAEAMRLLADTLTNNPAGQWASLDALLAKRNQGPNAAVTSDQILNAYRLLAERTGDKTRLLKALNLQLAAKPMSYSGNRVATVVIPDLVRFLGAPTAEKVLLSALTTSAHPLTIVQGAETRAVARRLARTNVAKLKVAQWELADLSSPPALYEAMATRFGANGQSTEAKLARFLHVFNLLRDGQRAQALKVAKSITDNSILSYLYSAKGNLDDLLATRATTAFLGEVVGTSATSPFWDLYLMSATRSREMGVVVDRLQKSLAQPNLSRAAQTALRTRLSAALLATDRVEEGLALLKKDMTDGSQSADTRKEFAVKYAELGRLLNRPAVLEEGLAVAKKLTTEQNDNVRNASYFGSQTLTDLLIRLGRTEEAEKLEIDSYAILAARMTESYGRFGNMHLAKLCALYYRLNRPQDVRTLLDQAPDWGTADVLTLSSVMSIEMGEGGEPIGYIAAWALANTGEKAAAETILNKVIADSGGFDPAYELLLQIKGDEAFIPRMDEVYAADQFEERPLIWKAIALKNQGKLAEAEATVRKAIAVDPSDGETHGGRRMRVYTVLAEILDAKGDKEAAANYRSAVAAIRTAEKADELAAVGLVSRAIVMYEDSLKLFQDAYCIQSRLAVDLMEQGREKEAEVHYRRAYELMPNSFGRVETHCMGCEHVFQGDLAQGIAEKVFMGLVKSTPDKPQVHYLLGYLRSEQGRTAEALASYRKAVALDPDYLNAWKQLSDMAETANMSAAERQKVADAILRLDPLQKHGEAQPTGSLSERWRQVDRAIASLGVPSNKVGYPLAASAVALKAVRNGEESTMDYDYSNRPKSGGEAVASDPFVEAVVQLIDLLRQSPDEEMATK